MLSRAREKHHGGTSEPTGREHRAEYVDGQTLRELLMGGPLPVRKALQIASQIADGLAAAHRRNLVHRDLKPENIMITGDGVVKILDFGLAKSLDLAAAAGPAQSTFSDPGTIVGTFMYMSPEQARASEVDYRSDQFALGAILYEMLTGQVASPPPYRVSHRARARARARFSSLKL